MTGDAFEAVDVERLRSGHGVKWGSAAPGHHRRLGRRHGLRGPARRTREPPARSSSAQDFGYPFWPDGDPVIEAFEDRMRHRHGWRPEPGRTRVFTDLMQILQVMIEHTTGPGDGVAIHVPAYPPFLASIARAGRRIVPLPMRRRRSRAGRSTRRLAERLRARLPACWCWSTRTTRPAGCSPAPSWRRWPRSPSGWTWWSSPTRSTPTSRTARPAHPVRVTRPDAAARTVTLTSATKAFNIAGLRCAVAHIGAERVHRSLAEAPLDYFGTPSTLSRVATVAAWREGDAWLAELMRTLDHNRSLVARWAAALPWDLRYHSPEATYLSWFDFTATPIGAAAPAEHLLRKARVLLSEGAEFARGHRRRLCPVRPAQLRHQPVPPAGGPGARRGPLTVIPTWCTGQTSR